MTSCCKQPPGSKHQRNCKPLGNCKIFALLLPCPLSLGPLSVTKASFDKPSPGPSPLVIPTVINGDRLHGQVFKNTPSLNIANLCALSYYGAERAGPKY